MCKISSILLRILTVSGLSILQAACAYEPFSGGGQSGSVTSEAAGIRPSIVFTSIPDYLSLGDIKGSVRNADPSKYKIALYLYISAWYNKPGWDNRLIDIQSNGSWVCSNTGIIYDGRATKFRAFLVTNGTIPPKMGEIPEQSQVFPAEFESNAAASVLLIRYSGIKTVQFSGYIWQIKSGDFLQDPGQNNFSDAADMVWVDSSGCLHLKAALKNGNWYCSEVCMTNKGLGYGKYIFQVSNRVDLIDKNLDLGLFLFDYTAVAPYREFDFEFMDWKDGTDNNACFVVQPYTVPANLYRYKTQLSDSNQGTTYMVDWSPYSLTFRSYYGFQGASPKAADLIKSWIYTGANLPKAASGHSEQVHMNLWFEFPSYKFTTDGNEEEVVIKKFQFIPK